MEQDTLVHDTDVSQDDYDSTAIDVIADSTIHLGKPVTELFTTDNVLYQTKR